MHPMLSAMGQNQRRPSKELHELDLRGLSGLVAPHNEGQRSQDPLQGNHKKVVKLNKAGCQEKSSSRGEQDACSGTPKEWETKIGKQPELK